MKNWKYTLLQVILITGIVVFAVLIYRSLMRPVKFNEVYEARKAAVIEKLKNIRDLQAYYKMEKGSYAQNAEQLRDFWNNGTMRIVIKEGYVPDTLTEAQAIQMKIVRRDTVVVSAKEEMLKTLPNLDINTFDVIPYSNGEKFAMAADTITRGNIKVYVYEVKALKSQYLKNLDEDKLVTDVFLGNILYSDLQDQFLGPNYDYKENVIDLILGSLTEASTDGNWQ